MKSKRSKAWCGVAWLAAFAFASLPALRAAAQPTDRPASADQLDEIEARLAERYDRLEMLAARLAELSGGTQPRRAELLRQLVARGRERDVPGQFDRIIAALADESYSTAIDGQTRLQADLAKLLELLLQEDRDRQLDSERKRVLRYVQELNHLIRLQRGVKARTEGGDDAAQLAQDQDRVGNDTEKLQRDVADDEAAADPADPSGGKPEGGAPSGKPSPGDPSGGEQPPEPSRGEQPSEDPSGEQQGGGQSPAGESSESSGESPSDESNPLQRTAERLERARKRMQEARERLENAEREGAVDRQERAVEQLELAKAELERILRQLREEELERMLTLLEARFRKMLDEQVAVYDETKRLDAATSAPEHEREIAAAALGRRETGIVREADRALVLLREDGTSLAFPEAVEQARDDMQQIADRLGDVKLDLLTQGMEEDVIAALEEILGALRQALEKLRDQQAQQQSGGGPPGEQPLVDQLAELRMIRALQQRVNRRTQQYGALIEGEQALADDVLSLLDELSLRQEKIVQATRDLETGDNQ